MFYIVLQCKKAKVLERKTPKTAKHIGVGKSNLIQIHITFDILTGYLCESVQ